MKKLLLAASVAALFATPVMANIGDEESLVDSDESDSVVALAENKGIVNFTGKIEALTCQIKQQRQSVQLPTLDVEKVGTQEGKKDFEIELIGCSEYTGKSVSLEFTPAADSLETLSNSEKVLKNKAFTGASSNQGASNVGLKITSLANGSNFNPLNESETRYTFFPLSPFTKAEAIFNFSVEYVKLTDGVVKPGFVSAALPFTVVYK